MILNPTHLIQFATIVEEGSFTRAAKRLNITQPALSRNISILEDQVGGALMTRGRQGVTVTEVGQRLLGYGQAISDASRQANDVGGELHGGTNIRIRFGATPYMLDSLLPQVLSKAIDTLPNFRIQVVSGTATELIESIETGRIDLAICPIEIAKGHSAVTFEPLLDDKMVVIMGRDNRLATKTRLEVADLEAARWVDHPRGSLLSKQMESVLMSMGVTRINAVMETGSRQTIIAALTCSDVISLVPHAYFETEIKSGLLTLGSTGVPMPSRPLVAVYNARLPFSASAKKFLVFIAEHLVPAIQ